MKPINYLALFIALSACNPMKRITGTKPNGSNYVLTVGPGTGKGDSVLITGAIRVIGSGSGENKAARGLQVIKLDTSGYKALVEPDEEGRFSYKVAPGKYYLFFAGIGFGKMKTGEFAVKGGQSAKLDAVLHPEVEPVCDDTIPTPYKTVPRRLP